MGVAKSYWLVCVLAAGGGKESAFTYQASESLQPGQVVSVGFKNRTSLGVALAKASQPSFKTKPILQVHPVIVAPYLLQLAEWMHQHYATPLARVFTTVLPTALDTKARKSFEPSRAIKLKPQPKLQAQQQAAVDQISKSRGQFFLLHGATGSGKTRVYVELAKQALAKGSSCIVLVPEISLTPQITDVFRQVFGASVVLVHSGMSSAERRWLWLKCLNSTSPLVVVGPRSALFMPLANLGYIVIDECHETTYKQDQAPRYHAVNVAAKLAMLSKAKLVLGSATPAASDVYLATQHKLELVQMPEPVHKNGQRQTKIVDLGDKSQTKQSYFLSTKLINALRQTFERGKQSILFINRRGSARLALCSNCDWVAACPNCHIPLTFHADQGQLVCHWCNYSQVPPAECPTCGKSEIRFLGGGTKRIETELQALIPKARVARLDSDSLESKSLPALYQQLLEGKVDVLIGTQMIAKGLDLPNVETVGVVLADTMLFMPDFSASERTFQLLYQVSGRAGRRSGTSATTIIQTYSPNHPAIVAAATGKYQKFIEQQLSERRSLGYPPFKYLLKLETTHKSRGSAIKSAELLAKQLAKNKEVQVIGPAPAWRETYKGHYTWQIIVKTTQRPKLVSIAKQLPTNWSFDLDPINLL